MERFFKNLKVSVTRNLPWKIAALLLAVLLWVLILNAIDPVRSFQVELPLTFRNDSLLETDLAHVHIENLNDLRNRRVTVTIRGNSRTIEDLRPQLVAYIDFSITHLIANAAANDGSIIMTVHVAGYGGDVDRIATSPSSVPMVLDTIITDYFDVEVVTNGEVDDDYFLQTEGITVSPMRLPITGPARLLQTIDRLVIDVNVNDLASTYALAEQTAQPVNAFNLSITSPYLTNSSTVHVEVPVYRRANLWIFEPTAQGAPPTGFGVYGASVTPLFFEVAGSPDAIAGLSAVRLTPVSAGLINYSTEDVHVYFDIRDYLPEGVFLTNPEYHIGRIDVIIEPFVWRDFTISRYDIQVLGMSPNTTILTDSITIRVTGLLSVMYDDFEITATANIGIMGQRDPGQHPVLVSISGFPERTTISPTMPQITIYVSESGNDMNDEIDDYEYNGYDDYDGDDDELDVEQTETDEGEDSENGD